MNITLLLSLCAVGILAGIISGMVGVGGGIVMVPAMVFLLGFSQHTAQGTAIFTMLPPIGILAAINYYKAGYVNWKYAIVIAIAFVIGGYLGSKLAISINERLLKKIFGFIMLIAAAKIIFGK